MRIPFGRSHAQASPLRAHRALLALSISMLVSLSSGVVAPAGAAGPLASSPAASSPDPRYLAGIDRRGERGAIRARHSRAKARATSRKQRRPRKERPSIAPAPATAPTSAPTSSSTPTAAPGPEPSASPEPSPAAPGPEPGPAPAPVPAALLEAGFESGLAGWNTAGVGDATPSVVGDVVRSGSKSAKVIVTGSQDRSELIFGGNGTGSTAGTRRFVEGDEYWYGFSFYIHSMVYGRPGAHNLIMQLKGNDGGSPGFGLLLWDYQGKRGLWSHGSGMGGDRYLAPVTEQQWHDVAIHFEASGVGDGFYELYLDGMLVDSRSDTSMLASGASYAYIKNGLYRNGGKIPGTSEIRLDAARLGTSLAALSAS